MTHGFLKDAADGGHCLIIWMLSEQNHRNQCVFGIWSAKFLYGQSALYERTSEKFSFSDDGFRFRSVYGVYSGDPEHVMSYGRKW